MKKFIRPLILISVVPGFSLAQEAEQQSGTYITYKFSHRLATETYRIRSQAGGMQEAEAEIEVTGQQNVKVQGQPSIECRRRNGQCRSL